MFLRRQTALREIILISCELEIIIGNVYNTLLLIFGRFTDHLNCAECWLAGKTRNTKEVCYGKCSPLTPGLTRAANLPEETLVCLYHLRAIERQDDRCSSQFQDPHSKSSVHGWNAMLLKTVCVTTENSGPQSRHRRN